MINKFHFGEAKFTTKNKNWSNQSEWMDAATDNQTLVFPLFQNNGVGVNSIIVRATDLNKRQELLQKFNLKPDDPILLPDISSFKIFGSGANQQIVLGIVSLYP